jgi:hypothetical protein
MGFRNNSTWSSERYMVEKTSWTACMSGRENGETISTKRMSNLYRLLLRMNHLCAFSRFVLQSWSLFQIFTNDSKDILVKMVEDGRRRRHFDVWYSIRAGICTPTCSTQPLQIGVKGVDRGPNGGYITIKKPRSLSSTWVETWSAAYNFQRTANKTNIIAARRWKQRRERSGRCRRRTDAAMVGWESRKKRDVYASLWFEHGVLLYQPTLWLLWIVREEAGSKIEGSWEELTCRSWLHMWRTRILDTETRPRWTWRPKHNS